jgi:hypothetical protein
VIEALIGAVACGRPVIRLPQAPPAAIVARTPCGTFEIAADGRVHPRRASSAPAWAPKAVSHPARGVWVAHPHGHLAVYRAGRLLWHSAIRHGTDNVVIRGGTIAFSVEGPQTPESLWLAQVGRPERRIAAGEEPIAWTAGGLLTQRGNEIRVRARNGRLVRVVVRGHGPVYDAFDSTVLVVDRSGAVVRTDGRRVWRLAGGFRTSSWVQLLDGRIIDVTTGRKSVFLRANGSPLGVTAPLGEPAATMGGVVALPNARGIVYVVNRGRHDGDPGVNSVYVAGPHHKPRLLYQHRVALLSCGGYAGVSYAHGRILYVDNAGPLAILDPTGRIRPVDLTRSLRVLQPRRASRAQLLADWRSNWR